MKILSSVLMSIFTMMVGQQIVKDVCSMNIEIGISVASGMLMFVSAMGEIEEIFKD